MKRSNITQKKQGNTLFSYFIKVKDPAVKKESLSSIIEKATTQSTSVINRSNKKILTTSSSSTTVKNKPIDLTEDDDDLIIVSSLPTTQSIQPVTNSQTSQGSFTTRERVHNEQLTNNSKFNKKAWTAQDKGRGPQASSQDASLLTQEKTTQRFERLVLNKSRITPKPTYDWLGPDDVKPYSSNYSSYQLPDQSSINMRKPEITVQGYIALANNSQNPNGSQGGWDGSSGSKRGWDDSFGSKRGWDDSIHIPKRGSTSKPGCEDSYGSSSSYGNFDSPSSSQNVGSPLSSQKSTYNNASSNNVDATAFWNEAFNKKKKKNEDNYANVKMEKFASNNGFGNTKSNRTENNEYRPDLSDEQQRVLSMVLNERKSLFFTGSAGTGKSVLLRAIIDKLGDRYGSQLAVTASTGIAACNINGCTLHSFAGIGIAKESGHELATKIQHQNRKARDRWTSTRVLVIDEISMVDADLFDKLDTIARIIRQNPLPFGGMQIIVTGDFFQLPPVNPNKVSKFAFEANSWSAAITQTVMLTKVFRQKDGTFVRILNEMRLGKLSNEAIQTFKSLSRKPAGDDDIEPTELYPLRNEVDESNRRRLEALEGEITEFNAVDFGDSRKMQSCLAPYIIQLKLNAQVMLLKNLDADLVNGSLGVVVGFVGRGIYSKKKTVQSLRTPQRQKDSYMDDSFQIDMQTPYPVIKFTGGRILVLERETWSVELPGGREAASRKQIPLMLAWAISIHKSQGQTLDRVKVDLGKVFEKGQAYVALSRATSLERLQILNFDPARVMAHPTVTRFYSSLQTV